VHVCGVCMYVCIYVHAYQGHDDRADPEPAQESVGRPSEVCERERKGGRAWEREGEREREDSQSCCVSLCTCVMCACACVCVRGSLLVWLGGGAVDGNTTLWWAVDGLITPGRALGWGVEFGFFSKGWLRRAGVVPGCAETLSPQS